MRFVRAALWRDRRWPAKTKGRISGPWQVVATQP
jgi:hypothetical protein